jgi:hypothetical protein
MVWLRWEMLKGGLKIEKFFVKFYKCDGGISGLDSTN